MLNKNRDFVFDRALTRNKALSVQLSWWPNSYACFRVSTKEDHAGVNLSWQVAWLMFALSLHDRRHWDCENDGWRKYETA